MLKNDFSLSLAGFVPENIHILCSTCEIVPQRANVQGFIIRAQLNGSFEAETTCENTNGTKTGNHGGDYCALKCLFHNFTLVTWYYAYSLPQTMCESGFGMCRSLMVAC